jgi:hypothetical protein
MVPTSALVRAAWMNSECAKMARYHLNVSPSNGAGKLVAVLMDVAATTMSGAIMKRYSAAR